VLYLEIQKIHLNLRPLELVALLREMTYNLRHPMGLRHPMYDILYVQPVASGDSKDSFESQTLRISGSFAENDLQLIRHPMGLCYTVQHSLRIAYCF